ncbi:MAG: acetyl-CoA carboxylase biotin carboxylase subunit [Pseudomonadota bacterium]
MFTTLLIANRGEIACRIIRTAKRLGLRTVAVYSDADRGSLHVELADEAYHIGDSEPQQSYLVIEKIIAAATASGAEAIHPGYGFLSENAAFSRQCRDAGIAFVGPPASAIDAMGSKSRAKAIMERAGVPLLPGYHDADDSEQALLEAARNIGFPVLLKASAGGGGKGMRIVTTEAAFSSELAAAKREARNSFGDDAMLVEKYLTSPRHIEVQVFADTHGNIVHLFDRDCSIQRRHQKIVEEAPAPGLSQDVRDAMASAAIQAARAIDYVGAGTIEFLLDTDERFYFMEMNTRLQVEHPVTEMITGVDLVDWQLRIAAGDTLPLSQDQLTCNGHAIESRIYAEDTDNGFLPQTGNIVRFVTPDTTDHVRIDTGVRSGDTVSRFYDPMIAKLATHASSRALAVNRMRESLAATNITGITTNLKFLQRTVSHTAFQTAALTTRFIEHAATQLSRPAPTGADVLAALALWQQQRCEYANDRWRRGDGWRLNQPNKVTFDVGIDNEQSSVTLHMDASGNAVTAVTRDGVTTPVVVSTTQINLSLSMGTLNVRAHYWADGNGGVLTLQDDRVLFRRIAADTGDEMAQASDGNILAPMTGTIVSVSAKNGERVEEGDTVAIMEAMKMEHTLTAAFAGVVEGLTVTAGDRVDGGQPILRIDKEE